MAQGGIYIGSNKLSKYGKIEVHDISAYYTDSLFFGVKNERGSILIETLLSYIPANHCIQDNQDEKIEL